MEPRKAALLNPHVLAYLGDTVYDLFVRSRLLGQGNAHTLHMLALNHVRAAAQARAGARARLTEDEAAIYRRARNAKPGAVPKNAKLSDYCHATAIEAVVGYLYITGADERLRQLMDELLCEEGEE